MNRIHVAQLVMSAILAGIAGCDKTGTPEAFPQAVADGWLGSFNGGDVDGLVLSYTENARVLPPDQPSVSGRQAIDAFWRDYNPGQVRITLGEVEVRKLGEYWFREGGYTATFPDEGEPRVGKFIELWKKEGNNWLLYRQMWNRNAPPPAQEPCGAPSDDTA